MALSEVLLKSESILKKYEKYDPDSPNQVASRKIRLKSEDPFSDKYFEIMDRVQDMNLRASSLAGEKNRALHAALNAELRKEKAMLLEELPALQRLVQGPRGRVTPEVQAERIERFHEARAAVESIPDGVANGGALRPQRELEDGASTSYSRGGGSIQLDPSSMSAALSDPGAFKHSDASATFLRDVTVARSRQDIALDNIERGLSTLKDLGGAMEEELQRHDGLIDEVGAKMDTVTKELKTNNQKLHGLVTQVRSTRRFFIDIILVCVALALGLYIYNILKK